MTRPTLTVITDTALADYERGLKAQLKVVDLYVPITAEASLRVCGIAASARRVQLICSARSVPPERKAEAVRLLDEIAAALPMARGALL